VFAPPEVSSVIIGASKPEQVEDNAGASGANLSATDIEEMDAALA
jgi:aryl-alcohol dehydrogenase-like predicted oxidoreductase